MRIRSSSERGRTRFWHSWFRFVRRRLLDVDGSTSVILGDEGSIVLPPSIRERRRWTRGTTLILVETPEGLLLLEREAALQMVRNKVGGRSLVDELIAERHAEAKADDDVL